MHTSEMTIGDYIQVLGSKAPVPGGGGGAAVVAALGAALGAMVCNLTIGKKKYLEYDEELKDKLAKLEQLADWYIQAADRDAEVFEPLAQAYSLPADTEEDRLKKEEIMEGLLLDAAMAPLELMRKLQLTVDILERLEKISSVLAISDVGVGVSCLEAALHSGALNVYINTKSMKDRETAAKINEEVSNILADTIPRAERIYQKVSERLS